MLYLCICNCVFGTWEHDFWHPWTILCFKYTICLVFLALRHMLYLCISVFCTCIFVIACFTHGDIIFDILEQSTFQKYTSLAISQILEMCPLSPWWWGSIIRMMICQNNNTQSGEERESANTETQLTLLQHQHQHQHQNLCQHQHHRK